MLQAWVIGQRKHPRKVDLLKGNGCTSEVLAGGDGLTKQLDGVLQLAWRTDLRASPKLACREGHCEILAEP
jgi:hypothetical protein